MTAYWNKLKLSGDPILVVGLRPKTQILGYRVTVDKNLHPDLRKIADDALAIVKKRTAIDYTPYVEPGEGEYLKLDPSSLTVTKTRTSASGTTSQKQQTARLLEIIQNADTLPPLGAKALTERLDEFVLQAVCLHTGTDVVGFVTKGNAGRVIKRSAIPLGFADNHDRFKKITRPEVVLEGDTHAILAPGEIAILNVTQFQFLVGDIGLVEEYAPQQVKVIAQSFKTRGVPLSASTTAALAAKAKGSVQLAKRLDAFNERVMILDVSRITSGRGFTQQGLKKADFVNRQGEIQCDDERVVELLDALEGRYFDDGFSDEHRRADRFRPRR
jgi:hypothetical protein